MADHGVLLKKACAAIDVGAWNRYAIAGSSVDLDNGNVFRLDTQNSGSTAGYSEVWDVTAPSLSGSTLGGLWMAGSDKVNLLVDGTLQYKGLSDDPRKFYNVGAVVFDAFKPQVGDVVEMSADCFSNVVGANSYVNAGDAAYEMAWATTQTASALSFKYIGLTYFSIGSGAINTQRVAAYKLVCVGN